MTKFACDPSAPFDVAHQRLDRWLTSPSQVCLLVGPGGSGKTTLLGQWSANVQSRVQWRVVSLFISREVGNWLARDWVPLLQAQLEQAGLDCSPPQNCNWRQVLCSMGYELATDGFNDGAQTLVILDGLLDSPSASELPAEIFGPTLAPGLKVLLTSRRDSTPLLASRQDVIVVRQPDWDATSLRVECERRGIASEVVSGWARVQFRSALEATLLLDAVARGLLELTPNLVTARAMWEEVFQRASRSGSELLSLLASCLAPLSRTDLEALVDEEHRTALEADPVVALLTTTNLGGAVLRHEALNAVVADVVGLDWGKRRLQERCRAESAMVGDAYAFIFGAYHWTPAAGMDALVALLDTHRQRKWRTSPARCWQWADELRLVVRRLLDVLVDAEEPMSPVIGAIVLGTLLNASVHESSEGVVSGESEQWLPIDDEDVLAVALARLSRFADGPAAQHIAQWAFDACKSKPATEVEVALTLPASLRRATLAATVRGLTEVVDQGDDSAFDVVLRATRALFRDDDAALETLRWVFEKHREPRFTAALARQVAAFPTRAKRYLDDWLMRDNVQNTELEAALLDAMDELRAGNAALRILSSRAYEKLSTRAVGRALRHVPEAALPRFAVEFAESPFAGDLATRYASLGRWEAALELMSRTQSWREAVATAVLLGAPSGEARCKDLLRSLEPDELARMLEGKNASALMERHGEETVFSWAKDLDVSLRCLVALVRNASAAPPARALERLRSHADGSTNPAELANWLALGPWSREPEAPAWVVQTLTKEQARRYLGRLTEPLLEANGRRFVVDDDPHLDLIDLMPLIRRIEGAQGIVNVAQALRTAWCAAERCVGSDGEGAASEAECPNDSK